MSNISIFNFNNNKIRTIIKDNIIYFIANDICNALNLKNTSNVMLKIPKEDKIQIDPKIVLGSVSNQYIWAVNESGLYLLIFKSKKEEAIKFKKWITSELLPTIRKTGSYSMFQDNTMIKHLNESNQKNNSKLINSDKFHCGGIDAIKNYNKLNCLIHTGKSTQYIKKFGVKKGLKKQDCQSAKQVIRKISPATACAMSFADSILHSNPNKTLQDIKPASLMAIKVFDEMLKIGIMPIEMLEKK